MHTCQAPDDAAVSPAPPLVVQSEPAAPLPADDARRHPFAGVRVRIVNPGRPHVRP